MSKIPADWIGGCSGSLASVYECFHSSQVQYHPRCSKTFLVCPMHHAAVVVNTDGTHKTVPTGDDVS